MLNGKSIDEAAGEFAEIQITLQHLVIRFGLIKVFLALGMWVDHITKGKLKEGQ